jgi:hypothetical protein
MWYLRFYIVICAAGAAAWFLIAFTTGGLDTWGIPLLYLFVVAGVAYVRFITRSVGLGRGRGRAGDLAPRDEQM